MPDFEETLQAEALAPKAFLEADARRRFARALRFRCRPLKELQTGQLVYYFRKGRKEGCLLSFPICQALICNRLQFHAEILQKFFDLQIGKEPFLIVSLDGR